MSQMTCRLVSHIELELCDFGLCVREFLPALGFGSTFIHTGLQPGEACLYELAEPF